MHRNTFINSPTLLRQTLQFATRDDLFFAGQITGTEGYVGSTMGGLLAGINLARLLQGETLLSPPRASMMGALLYYITHAEPDDFQPMKANMGILPELADPVRNKRARYAAYADRAQANMKDYLERMSFTPLEQSTMADYLPAVLEEA
jgi:methylenetetrahydrofolate--tRNA-(uracil-5-)-methyltransferase